MECQPLLLCVSPDRIDDLSSAGAVVSAYEAKRPIRRDGRASFWLVCQDHVVRVGGPTDAGDVIDAMTSIHIFRMLTLPGAAAALGLPIDADPSPSADSLC